MGKEKPNSSTTPYYMKYDKEKADKLSRIDEFYEEYKKAISSEFDYSRIGQAFFVRNFKENNEDGWLIFKFLFTLILGIISVLTFIPSISDLNKAFFHSSSGIITFIIIIFYGFVTLLSSMLDHSYVSDFGRKARASFMIFSIIASLTSINVVNISIFLGAMPGQQLIPPLTLYFFYTTIMGWASFIPFLLEQHMSSAGKILYVLSNLRDDAYAKYISSFTTYFINAMENFVNNWGLTITNQSKLYSSFSKALFIQNPDTQAMIDSLLDKEGFAFLIELHYFLQTMKTFPNRKKRNLPIIGLETRLRDFVSKMESLVGKLELTERTYTKRFEKAWKYVASIIIPIISFVIQTFIGK